tara:strand:+ start:107507 stop:107800 length:294 start_codon:yes stop_codon:yes gene_type:complete
MNYSGRTSAYEHKRDDWADHKGPFTPAIQQQTVFNAQWTDCPVEVEDEVRRLWQDVEYGNDVYYFSWSSEENGSDYPIIDEYLKSKGVEKCLIHWWW